MMLGFIGLGDMGLPMAQRLLGAGRTVVAWNRSAAKLDALVEVGAIRAASPAEVMARAELVGLCLTSDDAVDEVAWGTNGLFSVPLSGRKLVADFSTGSPEAAVAFAAKAKTHGASWVDAPVSGGVPAASAGSLIIFAGGEAEAIAALDPLLAPLCARVSHMGPVGTGQFTKICNQMIVSCNLLVIAETLAMARKAGVDVARLPAALKGGFADSTPLQIFGPRMAKHRFEPRLGAIALMEKDVGLASALSASNNAHTPMLALARDLYSQVRHRAGIDVTADLSYLIGLFEPLSPRNTQ
jgi:3-hydroxyisobutyrate dehydrogenase-like beta-hydroxyacid dehydrogenase